MQQFMPFQGYYDAMGFTLQELVNPQMLSHIFHGLSTDGLIEANWGFGDKVSLTKVVRNGNVPDSGIICTPSTLGVELLLWAFGHGDQELEFLLTNNFSAEIEGIPKSVSNAVATKDIASKSS